MVGTSGRASSRFGDGVPSGRNFPSRSCGKRIELVSTARSIWLPAQQIAQHIGAAAIGHQHDIDIGEILEPRGEHVRRRAVRHAEIKFARMRFGVGN
jgi:hypothetical protein